MVRRVLSLGTRFEVNTSSGKERLGRELEFDARWLCVVFVEDSREITIITVMWKH